MPQISVSDLTFAYDGSYDDIFSNVSFQFDTGWKLGFCGRNGRGKTTFLNLLMGRYEYRGTIAASVDFEYFPYPVDDISRDTLDILSSIAPDAPFWRIQKELFKLAVSEDALHRPFSTLSNGERTKALLAGLFLRENGFLLIDEPTNHLDMAAREITARYLSGKSGFILVSHDRAFLDECVDHILSINKADIEVMKGNFSTWREQKQRRDSYELSENEKLKKEVKRLTAAAKEKAEWSDRTEGSKIGTHSFDRGFIGHKAAKMMKRSKTIEKRQKEAAEEKSKLLKNIESAETLKLHPLKYHTSRLLSLEDVSVGYGGREIFRNVSFSVNQGDRTALIGGNGSGKSSIVKLLCGEDIPHTGTVSIGSRLVISYVPQDASFLAGDLAEYAAAQGIDESLFKSLLLRQRNPLKTRRFQGVPTFILRRLTLN